MNLSLEAISRLDQIVTQHNAGVSAEDTAAKLDCSATAVRGFLTIARRLGVNVKHQQPRGAWAKDPKAKAIMSAALKDAHRRIAALHTNGHA